MKSHRYNQDGEVDSDHSNGAIELVDVTATYALAEEDAVVIVLFYAHHAVGAMFCLSLFFNLAVLTPEFSRFLFAFDSVFQVFFFTRIAAFSKLIF